LEEERNKSEFKAKRRERIFWKSIVIIALVILIVWYFTTDTTANNWMGDFLRWIDTLDDNRKSTVRAILPFIVSLILIPLVIWMGKDVFYKISLVSTKN
jgi:MFS superfamily sulfate permease-like transporter